MTIKVPLYIEKHGNENTEVKATRKTYQQVPKE